jgi:hypothetical protein
MVIFCSSTRSCLQFTYLSFDAVNMTQITISIWLVHVPVNNSTDAEPRACHRIDTSDRITGTARKNILFEGEGNKAPQVE